MIASLFKDRGQVIIFCGLVLGGVCLVSGLFTSYKGGLGLAAYLGPTLGTIVMVLYIIKLVGAFVKDTAHEFWSDLCLVNMGLTLIGLGFVLVDIKEMIPVVFLWAGAIGGSFAWVFYKSGATYSRIGLVIAHVLLPTLLYLALSTWESFLPASYQPNGAEIVLAIATSLISIPFIMSTVSTHSPPSIESSEKGGWNH